MLASAPVDGVTIDVGAGGRPQLADAFPALSWIGVDRVAPADIVADAAALPLASGKAAALTMLDLLEHVDDDAALTEARRVLRPGGLLLVSVPALPSMWSYRDEAAGHLRRYSKRALLDRLHEHGFIVNRVEAYQCLLAPAVVAGRRLRPNSRRWRDREDAPGALVDRAPGGLKRLEGRRRPHPIAHLGTDPVSTHTRQV